jgi:hypothetical protein
VGYEDCPMDIDWRKLEADPLTLAPADIHHPHHPLHHLALKEVQDAEDRLDAAIDKLVNG